MFKGKGEPLIIERSFHKTDETASGQRSLTKESQTSYEKGYFNTY